MVELLVISNSPRCNLGLSSSGVDPVWVCLDTGSPVGVDLQDRVGGGGRRKFGTSAAEYPGRRSASAESHDRINSSTRKDQVVDLHRQMIQESFFMDRRRKGGSENQPRKIQEKICIGGEPGQDHLIDEKEQGVDFHRQRIQESFYID